jgi:hypothetical protein
VLRLSYMPSSITCVALPGPDQPGTIVVWLCAGEESVKAT